MQASVWEPVLKEKLLFRIIMLPIKKHHLDQNNKEASITMYYYYDLPFESFSNVNEPVALYCLSVVLSILKSVTFFHHHFLMPRKLRSQFITVIHHLLIFRHFFFLFNLLECKLNLKWLYIQYFVYSFLHRYSSFEIFPHILKPKILMWDIVGHSWHTEKSCDCCIHPREAPKRPRVTLKELETSTAQT